MTKSTLIFLLILTLFSSMGCGYLSEPPTKKNDVYIADDMGKACEIDPDKFLEFFNEDIEQEINCFESNLMSFVEYVEREDVEYINEEELGKFITKFFPDFGDSTIKSLQVVFDLNSVIMNDPPSKISIKNIPKIANLVRQLNKEGIKLKKSLKNFDEDTFWESRADLSNSAIEMQQSTIALLEGLDQNSPNQGIDIIKSLKLIANNFDIKINIEMVDGLLFVKRLFLGGESNILTHAEFKDLINKSPEILSLIFDFIYVKQDHFTSYADLISFYQERILQFYKMAHIDQGNELVLSVDEFNRFDRSIDIIIDDTPNFLSSSQKTLISSLKDLKKYITTLKALKPYALDVDPNFRKNDLRLLFTYLDLSLNIIKLDLPTLNSFIETSDEHHKKYMQNFEYLQVQCRISLSKFKAVLPYINVKMIFKHIAPHLKELGYNIDYDLLELLYSAKRLFLGGNREVMSPGDMYRLLEKTPFYADMYYKLRQNFLDKEKSNQDKYLEYVAIFETMAKQFFRDANNNEIISFTEFQNISKAITKGLLYADIDITKNEVDIFINTFKDIKPVITTSSDEFYSADDIELMLTYSKLTILSFFYIGEVYDNLQTWTPSSHVKIKEHLDALGHDFLNTVKTEIKASKHKIPPINIQLLLQKGTPVWTYLQLDKYLPFLESAMPFKELLLGGKRMILTHDELLLMIDKIPSIVDVGIFATAAVHPDTKLKEFFTTKEINDYFNIVATIPYQHTPSKIIFTKQELLKMLSNLDIEMRPTLEKLIPVVLELKGKILNNDNETFFMSDLQTLKNAAGTMLAEMNYGTRFYEQLSENSYQIFSLKNFEKSEEELEFRKNFIESFSRMQNSRTLSGFQFFMHEKTYSEYGLIEYNAIKRIYGFLLKKYGSIKDNNILSQDPDEFAKMILDFKDLMIAMNMWTKNFKNFSFNTITMADLFQKNSNGDMAMDLYEGTDYLSSILTSLAVGNIYFERMSQRCENKISNLHPIPEGLGSPAYSVDCFRDNFFQALLVDIGLDGYLEPLDQFVDSSSLNDMTNYLANIEKFARDFPQPSIPVDYKDAMFIIGSLINIESMMMRYDSNHNNILDNSELRAAFRLYKNVLISFAKLKPSQHKYAESIFLYMIKFQKKPSTLDLLSFHTFGKKSDISATRHQIASLLSYFVSQ